MKYLAQKGHISWEGKLAEKVNLSSEVEKNIS